ncbi:MAG: GNAT family N-acetyltransferase [Acidobacteria bacterium]|nr:GNAT family N-acetyltransferase [Acidobacteriota bacterium]
MEIAMGNLKSKVSFNSPASESDWNALCFENGNLLQSTHYDLVQKFYDQTPVYLEIYDLGVLVGGVKLYVFASKKLPWLFKQATVLGEPVISAGVPVGDESKFLSLLSDSVLNFNKKNKTVTFKHSTFYGQKAIPVPALEKKTWAIVYIDLKKGQDLILTEMHSKHRNMVNKAKKSGLLFEERDDISLFLSLMSETYKNQTKESPHIDFVRHLYETLKKDGLVSLYFVKDANNQYLSGALVQKFGIYADYTFGGNVPSNLGAGQYLHYNIALELIEAGFERYYLGQAANEADTENLKFSVGISRFKRRFGVGEEEGTSIQLIPKPKINRLWKMITKIRNKK